MRRWLRLGPSRAELAAEVQLWRDRQDQAEAQRNQAHVRAKTAEKALRQAAARVRELEDLLDRGLNEPDRVEGCSKVRFHRRAEAGDWAEVIAKAAGESVQAYETYPCKVCPRSPLTVRPYWHAGHAKKAKESKQAAQMRRSSAKLDARRDGRMVEQRVDPAVLDKLRQIGRE